MNTMFYNVTITVYADTLQEAYTKLTNALSADPAIEYETDTYDTPYRRAAVTVGLPSTAY